jgi:GGDEF domain-containing protein
MAYCDKSGMQFVEAAGLLAARIGGDEFALLLADCSLAGDKMATQKTIDSIADMPFTWGERSYEDWSQRRDHGDYAKFAARGCFDGRGRHRLLRGRVIGP